MLCARCRGHDGADHGRPPRAAEAHTTTTTTTTNNNDNNSNTTNYNKSTTTSTTTNTNNTNNSNDNNDTNNNKQRLMFRGSPMSTDELSIKSYQVRKGTNGMVLLLHFNYY